MKTYNIQVEINDIEADEEYYTFKYRVLINGKKKESGEINDDYENGNTPKEQVKMLKDGEALNLVMIRVFG